MTDRTRPAQAGRAPLSVETDLSVSVNGVEADVESTGERLLVGFDSVRDAAAAARGHSTAAAGPLDDVLSVTALTVEVRIRDRTVAVAGEGGRPGLASNALGVAPVEVRPAGVLSAVVAEASAAAGRLSRAAR